jgi:hypothetical protein
VIADTGGAPAGFTGGTVPVTTTTATQRITAMISSFVDSATTLTSVNYVLCYRSSTATADTDPTKFTTTANALRIDVNARVPFTAVGTVVPGVGTWDVGLCVGTTADVQGGAKQGFIQVTN